MASSGPSESPDSPVSFLLHPSPPLPSSLTASYLPHQPHWQLTWPPVSVREKEAIRRELPAPTASYMSVPAALPSIANVPGGSVHPLWPPYGHPFLRDLSLQHSDVPQLRFSSQSLLNSFQGDSLPSLHQNYSCQGHHDLQAAHQRPLSEQRLCLNLASWTPHSPGSMVPPHPQAQC